MSFNMYSGKKVKSIKYIWAAVVALIILSMLVSYIQF